MVIKALFKYGILTVATVLTVLGCTDTPQTTVVDFSNTASGVHVGEFEPDSPFFRVAVAAMVSPEETTLYYRYLLEYIGVKLGREVQLVQRKTYQEINRLLGERQIDLAFICSGPYVSGKERYGFQALAVPRVQGQDSYQAYLIVHRDSPFQALADLKGKTFAFTDPESNAGRLVPVFWLAQMGETAASFFKKVNYTYGHDNSIIAVARHLMDGASVHGHIWDILNHQKTALTAQTRIIKTSNKFGNPPMVASPALPGKQAERIRRLLLSMHQDPEGKGFLDKLYIDRFVLPKDVWYDPIRHMERQVKAFLKVAHEAQEP